MMPDEFNPQNPQPSPPQNNRGGSPAVDPSVLTTEALTRQITNLKELLTEKIEGNTTRIEAASTLNESRFENIEKQFDAIEAWRKEQKLDTKTAVDAALQAAEKAVREQTVASEKAITKSETSSTEQSRQQFATFSANLNGLSTIVNDVKERVLRIESRKEGEADNNAANRNQKEDTRNLKNDSQALIFAVVGLILTLLVLGVPLILFFANSTK